MHWHPSAVNYGFNNKYIHDCIFEVHIHVQTMKLKSHLCQYQIFNKLKWNPSNTVEEKKVDCVLENFTFLEAGSKQA